MDMLHLSEDHLFLSREELLADAYRRQEERIAYDSASEDATTLRSGIW
jgi:hypothetical protein